jgi:hypothetical protein
VIVSLTAGYWFGHKPSGTWGGSDRLSRWPSNVARTLFRIGMPYYRKILSQHEENR